MTFSWLKKEIAAFQSDTVVARRHYKDLCNACLFLYNEMCYRMKRNTLEERLFFVDIVATVSSVIVVTGNMRSTVNGDEVAYKNQIENFYSVTGKDTFPKVAVAAKTKKNGLPLKRPKNAGQVFRDKNRNMVSDFAIEIVGKMYYDSYYAYSFSL